MKIPYKTLKGSPPNRLIIILLCLFVWVGVHSDIASASPRTFAQAKRVARKIYAQNPVTFYCQCAFNSSDHIQLDTCAYKPTQFTSRTYRLEWEHIVPVKRLAQDLVCWRAPICARKNGVAYKGRSCCAKVDLGFQRMEADLHNLAPAIGAINQARSALPFGESKTKTKNFMGCPIKINWIEKKVVPPNCIKGTIARTYLYMSDKYSIALSQEEQTLYHEWNCRYPPDSWEIKRDSQIAAIQGDHNAYVAQYRCTQDN